MAKRNYEIVRLLVVLDLGVLFALALALFFIVNFGPSGRYSLTSALLEPKLLQKLNLHEQYHPEILSQIEKVFLR